MAGVFYLPDGWVTPIEANLLAAAFFGVAALTDSVIDHLGVDRDRIAAWPMDFMRDTELAWQSGRSPIDEI